MVELNKVHNDDCLKFLSNIESGSIDLVVTDPPYGMNYQSGRRKNKFNKIENDINIDELIWEYLVECERVMKDNTAIYVFCSWHKIEVFKSYMDKLFNVKNLIVWNKNNHGSGDLKGAYAPKHELVLFAHKGRTLFREKRIPDVIDCKKIQGNKLTHPTEKPVELLKTFVLNSSDEMSLVFDGFSGTGSLLKTCKETNRNFIGCELDSGYCDIANNR